LSCFSPLAKFLDRLQVDNKLAICVCYIFASM